MKKIFINGNNAKTGGGKTILQGLIDASLNLPEIDFIILVPRLTDVDLKKGSNIAYVSLPAIYQSTILSPWVYLFSIPRLIKKYKVDLVLNLGDLLLNTQTSQNYIFDWPYAVFDDKYSWRQLSTSRRLLHKFKLFLISRYIERVAHVFAQTEIIQSKLEERFNLRKISLLPVPLSEVECKEEFLLKLPSGKKFLYLSYYYPHKNFEVLLKVAKEIRKSNLNYKILITIEPAQHEGARLFLNEIVNNNLEDILVNLGSIRPNNRFTLMGRCDALLMPTLLETYGIPFIEAMQSSIPIFTSDLDFARCVCQEGAFYFNPECEKSIFECMVENIENKEKIDMKLLAGSRIIETLPSWNDYLKKAIGLIR